MTKIAWPMSGNVYVVIFGGLAVISEMTRQRNFHMPLHADSGYKMVVRQIIRHRSRGHPVHQ